MKDKEFKIFEESYYDKYGNVKEVTFFIKEKRYFLGIPYWKSITHRECGYGDCYKVKTRFETEVGAINFVKNILCKNVPKESHVVKEVNNINCS